MMCQSCSSLHQEGSLLAHLTLIQDFALLRQPRCVACQVLAQLLYPTEGETSTQNHLFWDLQKEYAKALAKSNHYMEF
jgi:hypothetical protein